MLKTWLQNPDMFGMDLQLAGEMIFVQTSIFLTALVIGLLESSWNFPQDLCSSCRSMHQHQVTMRTSWSQSQICQSMCRETPLRETRSSLVLTPIVPRSPLQEDRRPGESSVRVWSLRNTSQPFPHSITTMEHLTLFWISLQHPRHYQCKKSFSTVLWNPLSTSPAMTQSKLPSISNLMKLTKRANSRTPILTSGGRK